MPAARDLHIERVSEDPERDLALAKHAAGLTKSQDKNRAKDYSHPEFDAVVRELSSIRKKYALAETAEEAAQIKPDLDRLLSKKRAIEKEMGMKATDVLPVPVKTSGPVPMPTENDGAQRYAPAVEFVGDFKGAADASESEEIAELEAKKKAGKISNVEWARLQMLKQESGKAKDIKARDRGRFTKMKAADSVVLPEQRSGSEPADHLYRANVYEIQGDRARALDSYRAAASGYRRANDRVGEQKARDGVAFCQSAFESQYDHPGIGKVRVCDSADIALRTALERTRAGEAVCVEGSTVRPGRARAGDAEAVKCWECGERFPSGTTTYPSHQNESGKKCKESGKKVEEAGAEDNEWAPPPVDNPTTPAVPDPVPTGDKRKARDSREVLPV